MRKMNDSAQWQLIEVILVAGMLFAAMYLVRSSNVTVYKSIEEENPLQTQAFEALESIAAQPAPATEDNHNLLSYYVEYFINNGADDGLTDEIKNYFPSESNIDFKITIVDITTSKEEGSSLEACSSVIYEPVFWIEEESCSATRTVVVDKPSDTNVDESVYEVILSLWYNTGG